MKSKLLIAVVLVFVLILALQVVSWACVPTGATCSPGFWKNHVELWPVQYDQELMDDLMARGPGSDVLRDAAAEYLNSRSLVDYCADE